MNSSPDARIKVFVLWAPYLKSDSHTSAKKATTFMADNRVAHYWDLWRFGTRIYSDQLKLPASDAWDMFVVYKPHLVWKNQAPEPTMWMQNRNLKTGTPFKKETLEAELKKWLN